MPHSDTATVDALRRDVALQIARCAHRLGATQLEAATKLRVPQPTLSKIINGRVSGLSLELLIRVAVRAGIRMTIQTGMIPQEAGAFVSGNRSRSSRPSRSRLADTARESLLRSERALTPAVRLEAFVEHTQLMGALQQAGRAAEAHRVRKA